jgi:hypothetical protein
MSKDLAMKGGMLDGGHRPDPQRGHSIDSK